MKKKYIFAIIVILFSIYYGAIIQKNKIFPYYFVIRAYDDTSSALRNVDIIRDIIKKSKEFFNKEDSSSLNISIDDKHDKSPSIQSRGVANKLIETTLLPIKISGLELINFTKRGGAIASIGGDILITDKIGKFVMVSAKDGIAREMPYPDVPMNISAFYQQGDYGKHPHFGVKDITILQVGDDTKLFASHHIYDIESKQVRFAVSELQINPATFESNGGWGLLFSSKLLPNAKIFGGLGSGGRLAESKGGLLVSIGDFNHDGMLIRSDESAIAQNSKKEFGSIIEINLFNHSTKIISIGHRNPQGLTVTRQGVVFSTEHGPRGGDELNQITEGSNYGWPKVSLGMRYPNYSLGNSKLQGAHHGFKKPNFAWLPSIGISNLIELQQFNPRWDGDLIIGSLRAQTLFRARLNDGNILYVEPIHIGARIRDLLQLEDGTIVIWTDDSKLLFLTVSGQHLIGNRFGGIASISENLGKCFKCHHAGITNPTHTAPSLKNIVGRKYAGDKNYKHYSNGIKSINKKWSSDNLFDFLIDPASVVPGTSMVSAQSLGVNPSELKNLISELKKLH